MPAFCSLGIIISGLFIYVSVVLYKEICRWYYL